MDRQVLHMWYGSNWYTFLKVHMQAAPSFTSKTMSYTLVYFCGWKKISLNN